ncbi:MAG TPA: type II toxin-antitoxin system RelE/ParE family toxin [Myxococcota bacterium]|nr:type II toxin-antitoxin system RelE/ParE family toxin [Myxococcota bacterium]
MSGRCNIRLTRNFEANLEEIERFLAERDARRAFLSLLEELFDTIFPNLRRFPGLGADFLARRSRSAEGLLLHENLAKRMGKSVELREYITGDYLLLYAVRSDDIYMLSIKHHLQLSFDLKGRWVP